MSPTDPPHLAAAGAALRGERVPVRSAWRTIGIALLLAASVGPLPAQTPEAAGAGPAQRAIATQKLRLLEQLLGTPRVRDIDTSGDEASRQSVARARELLAVARKALDAGELPTAESATNEALRLLSAAAPGRGAAAAQEAREAQQRYTELDREIRIYREALADAVASGKAAAQAPRLADTDRLVAEARQLSAAARHVEARRVMTQAQQVVVRALSDARAGDTVTIELKFASPAEEYAHEVKRYEHHAGLLGTAVAEYKPSGEQRTRADLELGQARQVRARARASAEAGDHETAIRLMEQATGHLLNALRAAGMPAMQ